MRKFEIILIAFLLMSVFGLMSASAHDKEEFMQAKELIDSNISCAQLNSSQIEMIGDYFMEQIHPGEAHEQMDAMMGGDGSYALTQMHLNLAYVNYCYQFYDSNLTNNRYGMMGGGMMGNNNYGIIGNQYPSNANSYQTYNLTSVLINILLVLAIAIAVMFIIKFMRKK